jgi:superfamily II DNA/RNA helicase
LAKDAVEETLISILKNIHKNGPIKNDELEALAYIKKFHSNIFQKHESKIIYLLGLFYKTAQPSNLLEQIYHDFADSIQDVYRIRLTPIQASIYKNIKEKRFYSFSSPTSSGKSYLFRELIQKETNDIVIVVPSRALIAEYINEVYQLVDKSVLVLQSVENVNIKKTKRRIFIITPERSGQLFLYKKQFNIKMFLLDEAQISEEAVRGMKFDALVRRIIKEFEEAKLVFSHPFISNPDAQFKKHGIKENLNAHTFTQNSVGKIFIEKDNSGMYYFSPFNSSIDRKYTAEDIINSTLKEGRTILVYASKEKLLNNSYLHEYDKYLRLLPRITDTEAIKLITQLKEYIGADDEKKESNLVRFMRHGIVIHHGSMPLKARLIIEKFIKANYAKVCFATSTLDQGINMPFDVVVIENFYRLDSLSLRNLIGRAGRSTSQGSFDYGYTIINSKNKETFISRINEPISLSIESKLNSTLGDIDEDEYDLVHAIQTNNFNDIYNLPEIQLERLKESDIDKDINIILKTLFKNGVILKGNEYYELPDSKRNKIKQAFMGIYVKHLKKNGLNKGEKAILSAAIPILLWRIQGRSFSEIVSIRYYFLTEQREQNRLAKAITNPIQLKKEISNLKVRYSQKPSMLPDKNARAYSDFVGKKVINLQYDEVVYDTYDYLDKVISLSIVDPLYAAFMLYGERTGDARASQMANYIKFGTNDSIEIWLLKYGFDFEDIEWIYPYIKRINEMEIVFRKSIRSEVSDEQLSIVERYL